MNRILPEEPETKSLDLVAENVERLKEIFPDAFTEGRIDFESLKGLLGGAVAETEEKYGLNWHGKRRSKQVALTPSTGTLRPCPEESVDWHTTQNLIIEGDNLEVLKLLQKSYSGKVKLIYIDPPYNTGNDFVYPDDFRDGIRNYQMLTGQIAGDGRKLTSNPESSGRFHTEWLNMMYPRIKAARNLLREDGFIFVSIDSHESSDLRFLLNEIFGEENFVAEFVWRSRVSEDTRAVTGVSSDHEYILCYAKSDGIALRGVEKDLNKFSNPDNDARGPWRSADLTGLANRDQRPNLHYDLIDPISGVNYGCPPKGWRYEPASMAKKIQEGRILFPSSESGRPRHKLFLNEMRSTLKSISSLITSTNTAEGTRELTKLMGSDLIPFPKPPKLISTFIDQASSSERSSESPPEIVLDFFAGSGTTGQAVMSLNAVDQGCRRFILVQLPEILDKPVQLADAPLMNSIADLTKERVRRAGDKLKRETPMFIGDVGFRVFKLDSSNIRAWGPDREDLAGSLLASVETIKEGRKDSDVLYELLLKFGLDLCVPVLTREVQSKTVYSIGGGVLMACLSDRLQDDDIEPMANGIVAWRNELEPIGDVTCVFRDDAFVDDVAKTNLVAILEQSGIKNVRSL